MKMIEDFSGVDDPEMGEDSVESFGRCDACGDLNDGEMIITRDGYGFSIAAGFLCNTCRPWMIQPEADSVELIAPEEL